MSLVDIIYLMVLVGLLVAVSFSYRKFPRNQENLFELLTKDEH